MAVALKASITPAALVLLLSLSLQVPAGGQVPDGNAPTRAQYDTFGLPGEGWGGKLGIIVFEDERQYFSGSHVEDIRRCADSMELRCIAFEDVEFSVPKRGLEAGSRWEYNGRWYGANAETQLEIIGAAVDVLIIDATRNGVVENVFFFSPEHGLVAYSFYREGIEIPTQTWFLRRFPGILANSANHVSVDACLSVDMGEGSIPMDLAVLKLDSYQLTIVGPDIEKETQCLFSGEGHSVGTRAEELPPDYFQDSSECIRVWDAIFEEWVTHGGGVAESMAATRAQIQADRVSRLSALVRRSWEHQSEKFPAPQLDPFSWPVPISLSRQIDQSLSFLDSDRVPEHCQARFYLEEWLASDLLPGEGTAAYRKLKESPTQMD